MKSDLDKLTETFKDIGVPFVMDNIKDGMRISIDENEKTKYYDAQSGADFVFNSDGKLQTIEMHG